MWKTSGLVSEVLVFETNPDQQASFRALAILKFEDPGAFRSWEVSTATDFETDVSVTPVELLAHLEQGGAHTDSAFVVMQYEVYVPRSEFEDYIDWYQQP